MIKVSVIIPVYNGEAHLRECLDTVCNQTLKEIEIMCVDDGSTDSSVDILREYQEKDDRIKIFQQKNQYAGVARNLGKQHATGEYLMFWDCDDFFELNALEVLYERITEMQADICVCGANKYFEDKQLLMPKAPDYLKKKHIPGDVFNRKTNESYILNFTNSVPWNKMFRREFIEKLKLDYKPVRNGNDTYFTQCAIVLAERITTVDQALMNYRINQAESLVGTLSKSPLVPLQSWIDVAEDLIAWDVFPEQSFVNRVSGSVIYLLRNIKDPEAFRIVVEFLKKEGLEKLHIKEYEEGYFYTAWHRDVILHLMNDSVDEFRAYLSYLTYVQFTERGAQKAIQAAEIRALKKQIKEQQKKIDSLQKAKEKAERIIEEILNSRTYKAGKIVMWLPSRLKRMVQKKEQTGEQ